MSVTTDLGRVSIVPKGDYSAAVEYQRLDLVTDEGSSYIYINTTPSTGTALSNESYWMLISSVGGQDLLDEAIAARDDAMGYAGDASDSADEAAADAALLAAGVASPAGTYADLAALNSADPDHSKIYVTLDDGNWNYYSTGSSAFVAGGVYQAAGGVLNIKIDNEDNEPTAGEVDLTENFGRYINWHTVDMEADTYLSVYPASGSSMYAKISGTYTQEGTGDPSPDNIRPITPWLANGAEIEVRRTGKNLIPYPYSASSQTVNGVTFTINSDGSVLVNGTATDAITYYLRNSSNQISLASGNYFLSGCPSGGSAITYRLIVSPGASDLGSGIAFSSAGGLSIVYIYLNTGVTLTNAVFYPQLELGSTVTDYEPYSGQDITLTAPQEIAAGWMDNEGHGEAEWAKIVYDGDESWGNAYIWDETKPNYIAQIALNVLDPLAVCDLFNKTASIISTSAEYLFAFTGSGYIRFTIPKADIGDPESNAEAIANWKIWLASNVVTVYYQLATPTTLTPTAAPLTSCPWLDRVTPRQNFIITDNVGDTELTYAEPEGRAVVDTETNSQYRMERQGDDSLALYYEYREE